MKLLSCLALTSLGCCLVLAGDWLNSGGDPQHSGWQKRGKLLTPGSIKDLKLLWKRQLDADGGELTDPVIIGPTITHRGVRELVFAGGASDNLYAVDADLGTLFWKRHFESVAAATKSACGKAASMPTPAIEPDPRAERRDDDEPGAMRPVFAVASDGRLHAVRPSDGEDMREPAEFLSPNAAASSLSYASGVVYTTTGSACGREAGVWGFDVKTPQAKVRFLATEASGTERSLSIGPDGMIYVAAAEKLQSLSVASLHMADGFTASAPVTLGPVTFAWQGHAAIAAGGSHGLFVLDAKNLERIAAIQATLGDRPHGPSTWQDAEGTRWFYVAATNRIAAFKLGGSSSTPKLEPAWESQEMTAPGPPVITNGMVFVLTGGSGPAMLYTLDAATGKELFSSRGAIRSAARRPLLALANGHVCFTTSDGWLYCFGVPIE